MKTTFVFIFFWAYFICGQPYDYDSTQSKVCEERGHVFGNFGVTTLMGNMPVYIDLPDRTIIVNRDPNYITKTCLRCGKKIQMPVQEKPDTVIIWRKND